MKPLARWTIGQTNSQGIEILRHSVRRFQRIYPEFNLIICYNHLTTSQFEEISLLDVPIYKQTNADFAYPLCSVNSPPGWKYSMPGWGWKLAPPRLSYSTHELWLDNDIIIRKRLLSIDGWLSSQRTYIAEGRNRAYGCFETMIDKKYTLCAGIFGVPPCWDFAAKVYHYCSFLPNQVLGYYDEQGVTSCAIIEGDPIIAPLEEIEIVKNLNKPFAKGLHFIGINRTMSHQAWRQYKCCWLI